MKKWSVLLLTLLCVAALCLPLVGCGDKPEPEQNQAAQTEGMTEDKAIDLACKHWGIQKGHSMKDAQHVQRRTDVTVVAHPTEDQPYYVVVLTQLQGDGTWTTLKTVKLDGETGAVIEE